ncbi:Hypothetical protein R9X50_00365400 [Acrodontium crateriforme]|uniref:UFSP1/2/DUB catalytic domain-containing protein n=1 Tax=Acrodontium crateriforme TaxID=150365 RepID=A0AAQ3R7N3_9PEZI|nr:Hypothetical protein R9X50_00365400 [Acrodontium crateriforme]
MAETTASCPFCPVTSESELAIQLHIDDCHSDDAPTTGVDRRHNPGNPSRHNDTLATPERVRCDRVGCGEYIHCTEIDEHIAFHVANTSRNAAYDKDSKQSWAGASNPARSSADSSKAKESQQPTGSKSDESRNSQMKMPDFLPSNSPTRKQGHRQFHMPISSPPGRLGKRELGPHAFEKEMPDSVRRNLVNGAEPREVNCIGRNGKLQRVWTIENETPDVIPVLADLCALDPTTTAAYFCSSKIKHIVKIRCDGNFCGYWNIQMLLLHVQLTGGFPNMNRLPNIFQIQETIETAWRNGICVYGKTETGGIQNTRKWIGTQEVVAYFTQIGVRVTPLAFDDKACSGGDTAVSTMLDHVEAFFMSGLDCADTHGTSTITQLPPIYFQRYGHSMTIVGLERKIDGSRNLLVFDPSLTTSDGIRRLANRGGTRAEANILLEPYRRSDVELCRWDKFEIVVPNAPAVKQSSMHGDGANR